MWHDNINKSCFSVSEIYFYLLLKNSLLHFFLALFKNKIIYLEEKQQQQKAFVIFLLYSTLLCCFVCFFSVYWIFVHNMLKMHNLLNIYIAYSSLNGKYASKIFLLLTTSLGWVAYKHILKYTVKGRQSTITA